MSSEILKFVVQCFVTVSAVVPLIIALVKYINKYLNQSDWDKLVQLVIDLCIEAEANYSNGSDKKNWVMSMTRKMCGSIGYDMSDSDSDKISNLIDDLIDLSLEIN